MGNIFVQAFIRYIESHPQILEQLIEQLINALLTHLKSSTPAA